MVESRLIEKVCLGAQLVATYTQTALLLAAAVSKGLLGLAPLRLAVGAMVGGGQQPPDKSTAIRLHPPRSAFGRCDQ